MKTTKNRKPQLTSITATWKKQQPETIRLETATNDGELVLEDRCAGSDQTLGLGSQPKLTVKLEDFGFYDPILRGELSDTRLSPILPVNIDKGLSYKLELWAAADTIPEPVEVLFAGQKGFLRLLIENTSDKAVDISEASVRHEGALRIEQPEVGCMVAPGSTKEVLFPIEAPFNASPAFHRVELGFAYNRPAADPVTVKKEFDILVYRIKDTRTRVLQDPYEPAAFMMELMVEADTPMGFSERVEWSQSIHFTTSEPIVSFTTEITSIQATVMIPRGVTAGMVSGWGANMPTTLLSGFTILASTQPGGWPRKIFGWATAGLMGAAAGTSAVALKTALVLIIASVATPAWGIVVAVIIGRPVFETFLAGLLGGAGAAAGYDINLAIWDKIAEQFETNPPANP